MRVSNHLSNCRITTHTGIHPIPASDFLTIGHKIHDYAYDSLRSRARLLQWIHREILECLD